MLCEEKYRILAKEFDFKITEEVESMCTYTELIQRETRIKTIREGKRKWKREGIEEGKREGIEEGKTEAQLTVYANMKKASCDDNTICSYMGITMQKLMELKKLLSESVNLEPKTV